MGWMVNGGIKWSKVQEVGLSHVGPNLNFKPTTTKSFNHLKKPTPNPKPITVWWPKASRSIISSHVNQLLTLSTHKSSQQKLTHPTVFLSTHVEQTTARQATHRDPVASAASRLNPVASLSSFSQLDRIWWIFFVWFCFFCVYLLRNDIIYLFGSWENVRKCEQQVENVFSIVFSRTQPNTRKYFPKHFLKCNQTLENIFLSWKYFTPNQTQPKIHICIWIVTIYIYIAIVSRILFCTILHKLM